MSTLPSLGFAGIGLMGLPMCRRLLAAGYPLAVWNRNPDKCKPLVEAGARQVASPAELCQHADVVMLCLADTSVVREVVFGPAGIVEGAKKGQLLVDFSSLEPNATREMAAELAGKTGMGWLDTPVSGGVVGAEAGSLAIMVGGERTGSGAGPACAVEPGAACDTHGRRRGRAGDQGVQSDDRRLQCIGDCRSGRAGGAFRG